MKRNKNLWDKPYRFGRRLVCERLEERALLAAVVGSVELSPQPSAEVAANAKRFIETALENVIAVQQQTPLYSSVTRESILAEDGRAVRITNFSVALGASANSGGASQREATADSKLMFTFMVFPDNSVRLRATLTGAVVSSFPDSLLPRPLSASLSGTSHLGTRDESFRLGPGFAPADVYGQAWPGLAESWSRNDTALAALGEAGLEWAAEASSTELNDRLLVGKASQPLPHTRSAAGESGLSRTPLADGRALLVDMLYLQLETPGESEVQVSEEVTSWRMRPGGRATTGYQLAGFEVDPSPSAGLPLPAGMIALQYAANHDPQTAAERPLPPAQGNASGLFQIFLGAHDVASHVPQPPAGQRQAAQELSPPELSPAELDRRGEQEPLAGEREIQPGNFTWLALATGYWCLIQGGRPQKRRQS
ncbi:MAG: hypothetical protein KDA45_16535 [Planctomycetales bacterium]|nr:hypothetical protein [Planctomycetales bacterium]